jgi:hypothetical protein
MFFMIQAVIWLVAISLTSGDVSQAVSPDYDAANMDGETRRLIRAGSERLGWASGLAIDRMADREGKHRVTLSLIDRDQLPVSGAAVQAIVFHKGRIAEAVELSFKETDTPGTYESSVHVRHGGWWVANGTAKRDQDTFLIDTEVFFDPTN